MEDKEGRQKEKRIPSF